MITEGNSLFFSFVGFSNGTQGCAARCFCRRCCVRALRLVERAPLSRESVDACRRLHRGALGFCACVRCLLLIFPLLTYD